MNNSILITGSTGFVGTNLISSLSDYFKFNQLDLRINYKENLIISDDIIIHLAGKAHDLKNISNPQEYYIVNTELSKSIFDMFLNSNAKVFITLSSVKAVADDSIIKLTEELIANPITHYGKSKLQAEQYILSKDLPLDKRVFILRPCMIHGPGNKGNLNLLYKLVSKGFPWPLGNYFNSRSYLSIDNLCFIIKELIDRQDVPSGVYNVADDIPLSTSEVIQIIAQSMGKNAKILRINKVFISILARIGDYLRFPLNSERLMKLTESYVVCNNKIINAIGKPLPISSKEGLLRTFQSFSKNA
jgi:nucleoside-diphosphate-sugar epimerase